MSANAYVNYPYAGLLQYHRCALFNELEWKNYD